jgi:hypothetical protein
LTTIPESPIARDGSLPPEVARAIDDFVRAARETLGETLEAIVLFGSAADGTLSPASDVNVILVLTSTSTTSTPTPSTSASTPWPPSTVFPSSAW